MLFLALQTATAASLNCAPLLYESGNQHQHNQRHSACAFPLNTTVLPIYHENNNHMITCGTECKKTMLQPHSGCCFTHRAPMCRINRKPIPPRLSKSKFARLAAATTTNMLRALPCCDNPPVLQAKKCKKPYWWRAYKMRNPGQSRGFAKNKTVEVTRSCHIWYSCQHKIPV